MPKTRYITETDYPLDLTAKDKTQANAEKSGWIKKTPYEVSGEVLQAEADDKTISELSKPDKLLKASETAKLMQAMARQRR